MRHQINPNLRHLTGSLHGGYRGALLLGSSRSAKTWSGIDFLVYLCTVVHPEGGKVINIVRETYNSFKTTLYNDFNNRLPDYGISSPFLTVQECRSFSINRNKITLMGADDIGKVLGAGSDYIFFNEILHIPKVIFDQMEMRCSTFWWADSNPEFVNHWVFKNVQPRSDVSFLKTTFLDNPFCPPKQREKILSYDPSNPINVEQGTADQYMWNVFGLGIKAERKGRVYPNLYDYTDLPQGATFLGYGGDFGSNHPTVVVKLWIFEKDLFVQQIIHKRRLDYTEIYNGMIQAGYKTDEDCCFDSEDPMGIKQLKRLGLRMWRAYKKQGWVLTQIRMVSALRINIHVDSVDVKSDLEKFCWKIDPATDETVEDKVDEEGKDSADAIGYGVVRFVYRLYASSDQD